MNLFLHIGTEKTGSSFIQSTFARNRGHLRAQRICYPSGGRREKDMMAGRISPGNAKDLTLALSKEDWEGVRVFLLEILGQAINSSAKSVLLSNENLVEPLSNPQVFDKFLMLCTQEGFSGIHVMLVLRDPADHALSLFKHRAKSGLAPELDDWLRRAYHLPLFLETLLPNIQNSEVQWMIRKYHSDSSRLMTMFFRDWLQISLPSTWDDVQINPSLTLSELLLLKELKISRPRLVEDFYYSMLSIPKGEKSDDAYMKVYAQAVICDYLSQFKVIWQLCNQLLSASEQLQIPEKGVDIHTVSKTVSFSDAQLRHVVDFWKVTSTPTYAVKLKVRSLFERIKGLYYFLMRIH